MAKKFSIAQNATFKNTVDVPRIGGESIKVGFEFKYLTRKQLSELQDKWNDQAQIMLDKWRKEADDADKSGISHITEDEINHNIAQLKDIVVGWEFSEEFNDENIRALVESSLAATDAVIKGYHEAYTKAKLGN